MDAQLRIRIPTLIVRRLALDAALLWIVVRTVAFAFSTFDEAAGVVPSPRMSFVVVVLTTLLCYLQVRGLRETNLLRNLGIGLPGQVLIPVVVAGTLEIASRVLLQALGAGGGA